MNQETCERFKELRQYYYLSGRCLIINQLFPMAGINFGYSIELSLKFLLALNGHKQRELMKHHIKQYYEQVITNGYIPELNVSDDFLQFMDDRLNARYPSMIGGHINKYDADSKIYYFPIDMLHCYDDFILQLDDSIVDAAKDPRISIGFRCCRELLSLPGRLFFHCNDHAFTRIPRYQSMLENNRDENDDYDNLMSILGNPVQLWNFKGLISYRPWGPKESWNPAESYQFPKFDGNKFCAKAALWNPNLPEMGVYLSSQEFFLLPGKYRLEADTIRISSKPDSEKK